MTQPDGTDGKLEDVRLAPMELNEEEARELEEKFDSEMRFRKLSPATAWLVGSALVTLSLFHYYTAGFGLSAHSHRARLPARLPRRVDPGYVEAVLPGSPAMGSRSSG